MTLLDYAGQEAVFSRVLLQYNSDLDKLECINHPNQIIRKMCDNNNNAIKRVVFNCEKLLNIKHIKHKDLLIHSFVVHVLIDPHPRIIDDTILELDINTIISKPIDLPYPKLVYHD